METKDWWVRAHSGEINFSLLAPTISRILAYDLFIHNVDRHLNNYIVRRQNIGHAILAFDYSQAWMFSGFPLPELPLNPLCKTIIAIRALNSIFGDFLQLNEVKVICDRLRQVNIQVVERIMQEHPSNWLTIAQIDDIINWRGSDKRLARIQKVEEGIANGSFL